MEDVYDILYKLLRAGESPPRHQSWESTIRKANSLAFSILCESRDGDPELLQHFMDSANDWLEDLYMVTCADCDQRTDEPIWYGDDPICEECSCWDCSARLSEIFHEDGVCLECIRKREEEYEDG